MVGVLTHTGFNCDAGGILGGSGGVHGAGGLNFDMVGAFEMLRIALVWLISFAEPGCVMFGTAQDPKLCWCHGGESTWGATFLGKAVWTGAGAVGWGAAIGTGAHLAAIGLSE